MQPVSGNTCQKCLILRPLILSARSSRILERIETLKRRVTELPLIDELDRDRHTQCTEILREAFQKLNYLKVLCFWSFQTEPPTADKPRRTPEAVISDATKESLSIAQDLGVLEKRTSEREALRAQAATSRTITLYAFMLAS